MKDSKQLVEQFLNTIKTLRVESNLSMEELAQRSGIHRTTLGLLERHERVPSLFVANQIAVGLGSSLAELVAQSEKYGGTTSQHQHYVEAIVAKRHTALQETFFYNSERLSLYT
jgi:transcriptional regulator with XRE-family HTH domain